MNIAQQQQTLVIFSMLPQVGGHTTTTIGLCHLLGKSFARIIVLCKTMPAHGFSEAARQKLIEMGCEVWLISDEGGKVSLSGLVQQIAELRKIEDLVFIVMAMRYFSVLFALALRAKVSVYYHITHDLNAPTMLRLKFYSFVFTKILFVSPVTQQDYIVKGGGGYACDWCLQGSQLPAIDLQLNQVRPAEAGVSRSSPLRFGLLGRLSRAKGAGLIAEFANSSSVRCELHVAGSGEFAPEFSRLSEEPADRHRVRVVYHGAFDASTRLAFLARFFAGVDYLIVPTLDEWESITMAILEALQHGVPILATRTGGLRSFEQPELGMPTAEIIRLVAPGEFLSLVETVAAELRPSTEVSERCRNYYERIFGSDKVLDKWLRVLAIR